METITGRRNPLIAHLKKLGASREYRRACGEYICDGIKLLVEALEHNAGITAVLTSGDRPENIPDNVPVFHVPRDLLEYASPLTNPQEVLFSCKIPEGKDIQSGGRQIILENIQDPGNVGTIIRTANALGFEDVILTGSCADPYNPKTIRATMGAVFRQKVTETGIDGIIRIRDIGMRLYGAALGGDCRDIREAEFKNAAVVIGNEGRGLSDEMLALCDEKIMIPMKPGCESLNAAVAAAVIMWEMSR